MSELQSDPLSAAQLVALVEGMLSTARIDGLQPKEEALIRGFYDEQRLDGMPAYDAVAATAGQAAGDASRLGADAAFAEQFVLMCLMTGYADGRLSEAELQHVRDLARRVGVGDGQVDELRLQVKDALIGSLAHLPDPESVAALAKSL